MGSDDDYGTMEDSFSPTPNYGTNNMEDGLKSNLREHVSNIKVSCVGRGLMVISGIRDRYVQALQDGTTVVIGGKTSRSKIKFPEEMNRVLVHVPEINKPSDVSRASTMVDDIGMDEGIKLTDMLKLLKTLLCSMEAMK
ncbi:hypothetical protein Tco_0739087 [Tanacetum coccineum]